MSRGGGTRAAVRGHGGGIRIACFARNTVHPYLDGKEIVPTINLADPSIERPVGGSVRSSTKHNRVGQGGEADSSGKFQTQ